MQWANCNAELDRLRRFCITFKYVQAETIKDSAISEVEQVKAKITETTWLRQLWCMLRKWRLK